MSSSRSTLGTRPGIEQRYLQILALLPAAGIELALGHRSKSDGPLLPYQDSSAIFIDGEATAREHFGYSDGISNPYFKGAGTGFIERRSAAEKPPARTRVARRVGSRSRPASSCSGTRTRRLEYPVAPIPNLLGDNGTYLVYRKLHQKRGQLRQLPGA